ncbi:bifunctional molybdopterin-guanine dinucleotide biosynthesis adaptor protein MobB/molybdopterin molybdotransferase MoeA [Methylophaga sp. OBS3]|uniref:molybdopterin molybdotransferase MoeA n=1 Tax=Methylophaga sp. OBS3 TaxID=2991934 RepID=UPI002255C35D|nr:bifunctional molybdopterin-guanine dinucleotide biosynthesis adaptor protein MobB/molybdopterin molybdotransferase MoeA [Methylophaga sp. OBS3]MCX4190196.1 bifunctional molybdopterin-guanine dinucleotide biosynthesis adaptor protein MobB/molybdopterin molybdotransferase MoeA [Methylophaga sp. OBS3]
MRDFTPADSCAMPEKPSVLRVEAARQKILEQLDSVQNIHMQPLRDALDRVLAEDVISPFNVPQHPNSAMDGYALAHKDLASHNNTLTCVGTAFAGSPFTGSLSAGQCVRIMTGAMMPSDCDTVIMQEQASVDDQEINFAGEHQLGQNVRLAGEDIQQGQAVLAAGRRINAADLGLLASLGIGELKVRRKLRVAFFSTGDELKSIGETLTPGDIYDSNRYTLFGMLQKLGVDMLDMGVVKDSPDALRLALESAAANADIVITSGGVSVGDADYIKPLLAELGEVNFWKIAMKPGRPLTFGHIQNTPFFGLPGNPVSVMVTFYQFVLPALLKMAGNSAHKPLILPAVAAAPIRKRSGRFEFQRGVMESQPDGSLTVRMTGEQGSGILSSMSHANCFILLDEDCEGIQAGEHVSIQPFAGLI